MDDLELVKKILKTEKLIDIQKQKNRIFFYNKTKVHKKQMAFHKCKKRNRWVFGGNRCGKTECGAVEAIWMARGIHPYRKNKPDVFGWVVSVSREVQRDVAQSKILYYLNPDWIEKIVMLKGESSNPSRGFIDFILIRNVFGGLSKIGFKSAEMGREKFQGAKLDFVWFDEEPPEDIYLECKMRVLDKKGDIFGTMTPLLGLTFIYHTIYLNEHQDKQVWCEFMEWADNPYLDKKEIKSLSATLSDDQLLMRRYGKFTTASGLVYPEFDENIHVIQPFDIPSQWQYNLSIDPGLHNPLSCHWYAVDGDGVVYVVAEHYEAEKEVAYHAEKITEISDKLGWKRHNGKITALIDSASTQHTLNGVKSVADLFFDHGILVNPKVNKDVFSGINKVKEYLKPRNNHPKLYIFANCVQMIKEIKGYFWGSGDAPRKVQDHAMDELRYLIMSLHETHAPVLAPKSRITLDKEKLIKKLRKF